jgi:tetratricopeptide (TPR) repeat protein
LADFREAARLDPKRVTALTAQGDVLRKRGDYDKAIAIYDRVIKSDPTRPATYKLRADAYAEKGDRKRAMADIDRALKVTWKADLLKVRGELRLADGDLAGVAHDADAMLKLQADNADALALRGAVLARKQDSTRRSRPTGTTRWRWACAGGSISPKATASARSSTSIAPSPSAASARRSTARAP